MNVFDRAWLRKAKYPPGDPRWAEPDPRRGAPIECVECGNTFPHEIGGFELPESQGEGKGVCAECFIIQTEGPSEPVFPSEFAPGLGNLGHQDLTTGEPMAFDHAWDVVKTPLDYDSIDPFLLDNIGTEESVYQPEVDEHGFRIDPWEEDPKTQFATFIHPETGERYPIQITTPSFSHDFNIEMLYPDDAPRSWDGTLSRDQAAMVHVGYPNEEPPTQELADDFRMRFPPKGTQVEVHPYVTQDNRRQGMATALYDLVERLGYPIRESDVLSDDGEAFWSNRRVKE